MAKNTFKEIEFDLAPPVDQIPKNRRLDQKGIIPTATKFRLLDFWNPVTNTLDFYTPSGFLFAQIDLKNGMTTFFGPVNYGVTVSSLVKELRISLLDAGSSGGGSASYFTSSASFIDIQATNFRLNPADYPGTTIKLEATFKCGNFGAASRTLTLQLYDIAAGAAVTNAEIISTTTATAGGEAANERSVDFLANLTTGERNYRLRYSSSGGGLFVDVYRVALLIRF